MENECLIGKLTSKEKLLNGNTESAVQPHYGRLSTTVSVNEVRC